MSRLASRPRIRTSGLAPRQKVNDEDEHAEDTSLAKPASPSKKATFASRFASKAAKKARTVATNATQYDDDTAEDSSGSVHIELGTEPSVAALVEEEVSSSSSSSSSSVRNKSVAPVVPAVPVDDAHVSDLQRRLDRCEASAAVRQASDDLRAAALEQRLAELEVETSARAVEFLASTAAVAKRLEALEAKLRAWCDACEQRIDALEATSQASSKVDQCASQLSSLEDRVANLPDARGDLSLLEQRVAALVGDFHTRIDALQAAAESRAADTANDAAERTRQCESLFNTLNTVQERVDGLDSIRGTVDGLVTGHAELRQVVQQQQQQHGEWPHTPAHKQAAAVVAASAAAAATASTSANAAPDSASKPSSAKKQTPAMDAQTDVLPLNVVQFVSRELHLLRQQLEAKMKLTSQPLVLPVRHVSRKLEGQFK